MIAVAFVRPQTPAHPIAPALAVRTAQLRLRARMKDDGSHFTVVVASDGSRYLTTLCLHSERGLLALWLRPVLGSA